MIKPDLHDYCRLAGEYGIIPVYQTVPADLETPISLYLKLTSGREGSFLLESGDLGEAARYSFVGCDPFLTFYSRGEETVIWENGEQRWRRGGDPLTALENIIDRFKAHRPQDLNFFWGGAVGYLSYDLVKRWEKLPLLKEEAGWPSSFFYFPGKVFVYDHRRHLLTAVVLTDVREAVSDAERKGAYHRARRTLRECLGALETRYAAAPAAASLLDGENPSCAAEAQGRSDPFPQEAFAAAVQKAKEYIHAGEIFQVVLSRSKTVPTSASPFSIYRALRSLNPSPYQYYLSFPGFQVVGSSPEMLVKLEQGTAWTKPIAGTRPRGRDEKDDQSLAAELSGDAKERAEHMMLVDLGRNDLGKVSRYGSVKVPKLLEVEYFSHVMHLVSEVQGELAPGRGFADLLRAAFPAGTVSGAPKVRAMEVITELEPEPRGPYAGAVGYIGFHGGMDTCIAIRTIFTRSGTARLQAGAGIVADSEPAREYEETEHKLAGPLRAVADAEEWETHAVDDR